MSFEEETKFRDELAFMKSVLEMKLQKDKYEVALKEIAMANNPARLSGCPSIARDALGEALYE